MEIRSIIKNDDLFQVSRIYETSWRYAYKEIVPQEFLDGISAGQWVDRIKQKGRSSLLLTERGQPVGTASFSRSRWEEYGDWGEIISLYLLPDFMGKGYGRALLEACVERLREQGFRRILLWVLEENHRARNFYEKAGFLSSGVYKWDNIGGKDLRELMYFLS